MSLGLIFDTESHIILRMNLFSWRILRMKNSGQRRTLWFPIRNDVISSHNCNGSYGRASTVCLSLWSPSLALSPQDVAAALSLTYTDAVSDAQRGYVTCRRSRSVSEMQWELQALHSILLWRSWQYQMVFISDPSWEPSLPPDSKAIILVLWQDITHMGLWCSQPGCPSQSYPKVGLIVPSGPSGLGTGALEW